MMDRKALFFRRTLFPKWVMISLWMSVFAGSLWAEDYSKLDEATSFDLVNALAPVFDFDGDGCLPSAGISRYGDQNPGLSPTGSIAGQCRSADFLQTSNTVHRHACVTQGGVQYCGHFYSLYFEKDQATFFGLGHRHDWEHAAVWTINGSISHGSVSAHGNMYTRSSYSLPFENGHMKVVYHKDGASTHAFRFGGSSETAENPEGRWVTPTVVSWFDVAGDNLSNLEMRQRLNGFHYGAATVPVKDSNFYANLNRFRPAGFPEFRPLQGSFKVKIQNEWGQEGVVASWGAHQGLVNGWNPLLLYTGSYETCRRYDCDLTLEPINGQTAPYRIKIRNEWGQEGVIASWGAHQGLVNGGNPLLMYTGSYDMCRIYDCDFYIESIPGKPNGYKISIRNEWGEVGTLASWGAHQGIYNGGNPLRVYTGTHRSCRTFDCDFIIEPAY